jgi:hypothetical protein
MNPGSNRVAQAVLGEFSLFRIITNTPMTIKVPSLVATSFAALCTTLAADAAILMHTFDVGGLPSEGSFSGQFPTLTHDFGTPGTIISVTWDLKYTATDPSFVDEALVAIDSSIDLSLDADLDPRDFGATGVPGDFSYSGTIAANTISDDGKVYLTLYESFDDVSVNPDAVYDRGSYVTVKYAIPDTGATLVLFGSALTGLAGLRRFLRRN